MVGNPLCLGFPSREAAAHDLDLAWYALNGETLCGTALTDEETNEADGWSGNVPGYVLELRTARDDPGLADLKTKAIKNDVKNSLDAAWKTEAKKYTGVTRTHGKYFGRCKCAGELLQTKACNTEEEAAWGFNILVWTNRAKLPTFKISKLNDVPGYDLMSLPGYQEAKEAALRKRAKTGL